MGKEFSMSDKEKEENCKLWGGDLGIKLRRSNNLQELLNKFRIQTDVEERNDVVLYKTIRYPPKKSPPNAE